MRCFLWIITICLFLTGCQQNIPEETLYDTPAYSIELSDNGILYEGNAISEDSGSMVYAARDIIYYPTGKDLTFGEGTETDAHDPAEAEAHTVVHITKPGMYRISGTLSAGQIAVDLGKDAKNDPNAVVELIFDGVDISCSVAPAVIFYNVFECGDKDNPTKDVDTSDAGAVVRLADGSVNYICGSYVARIYKPESVELNAAGTEVVDAKKLHKYDAAFYSKMSMNLLGSDGILNIQAENEGLDSEMHLTINGGIINIESGNDGINTNEDRVSVTTINGGNVNVLVNGSTGEGDGIDSNGWLVINGGTVTAAACGFSMDSGIDSDMGIHINGGTVIASGNMLDEIEESKQNSAVFRFHEKQQGGSIYQFIADNKDSITFSPGNDFTTLIVSSPLLIDGDYTLWQGDTQFCHCGGSGGYDGEFPVGMTPPNTDGLAPHADVEFPIEKTTPPQGFIGRKNPIPFKEPVGEVFPIFTIRAGVNLFRNVGITTK